MATFRLQVVSLRAMLFDGEVKSVYLYGDQGEYELLPFHFPVMGTLPEGEIKVSFGRRTENIPIKSGIVLFQENRCTIIVEESEDSQVMGTSWSALEVLKKTDKKSDQKT
ncbi:MAG: hypothetical protein PHN49_05540 [Candidatus Omnitrophica bacterium]|nr:hypothetical protein [Candidatus Omnitrophota bacterium]MDD5671080.1 hypothetical protein [Candidatus Omnitrophota bacterium]